MKNRVKKFLIEREEAIVNVSRAVILTCTAYTIYKIVDGQRVISGDHYLRDDGLCVMIVTQKNGSNTVLTKRHKE